MLRSRSFISFLDVAVFGIDRRDMTDDNFSLNSMMNMREMIMFELIMMQSGCVFKPGRVINSIMLFKNVVNFMS